MTAPGGAVSPPAAVDTAGYARLAVGLRQLLGVDLEQYRPAQMWRRVNAFATGRGLRDVDALIVACRQQSDLLAELRDMLTINVSEFFRDPDVWAELGRRIGPMLTTDRTFRAWSAGCSTGFEPYSLAILMAELSPTALTRIVATDVDPTALAVARAGRYDDLAVASLSPERRERSLARVGEGWVVRPEVRAKITFRRHDLLGPLVGVRAFDLIVCRNVVIYFTEGARTAVHQRLADALRTSGVLFVGASEAILQPSRFGLVASGPGFYVKTG